MDGYSRGKKEDIQKHIVRSYSKERVACILEITDGKGREWKKETEIIKASTWSLKEGCSWTKEYLT